MRKTCLNTVYDLAKKDKQDGIYQSKIVETLDSSKVKITRIIDKLEQKELIERKRRGMTNIVVLR